MSATKVPLYERRADNIHPWSRLLLHSRALTAACLAFSAAVVFQSGALGQLDWSLAPTLRLLSDFKWLLAALAALCLLQTRVFSRCLRSETLWVLPSHLRIESRSIGGRLSVLLLPRADVRSVFIYEAFGFNQIVFKLGLHLHSDPTRLAAPFCSDELLPLASLQALRKRLLTWAQPPLRDSLPLN